MSRPNDTSAAPSTPAPRFAMGWAALAYALAALVLAYPVLSGQFLVNLHSDQYMAGFAFRDFAAQALRAGQEIPHWNPYMFGGLPYVAAMHGDIFYPTAFLRVLMRTDLAMTWGFILHLFASGLFTFGFLRAWGLGFVPSLIGGLAYMLSGPIASYASPGHDGKLFVSALLPLGLWLLIRGVRDGRLWAWGAFALTVGLGLLSPHPQLFQYLLLTCGAFALFLALGPGVTGEKLERKVAIQRLGLALAAVVLGMAMGAIQYMPVREYVSWSPRSAGHDWATATSYSLPLLEMVNLYLPQFTGILDRYWGQNGIHFHSEYIGGPVLLLASLAVGSDRRRAFRRFWIATGIIAMLWMLGGSTPFFRIIYELVPGTKFFRAPSTIIYVFAFALSVLAALGLERVLARQANPKVVYGWLAAGLVIALLATGGVVSGFAEAQARGIWDAYARAQGMDPAAVASRVQLATANRGAVLLGAWRSFLFVGLAAGLLVLWLRGKVSARMLGAGVAIVVAADLLSVVKQYWMFLPPASSIYASDPVIELLKREDQPGRVLVRAVSREGLADRDPYFGNDFAGKGTGLMVHGIRSVTGYHGNELGRYQQLSGSPVSQNGDALMMPTFWRHENARYLYTNAALPDSQLKLLVGPVKNSSGSTVYLYRLPGENPYAWVAAAKAKAPDSEIAQAVLDPRFDPLRLAVYSDTTTLAITPLATLPEPLAITTTTSDYRPGHATIALSAPAPENASLVVSENYYPGWTATVNGATQPVYRVNYNLIGIPLPAGAQAVELSFHDAGVSNGKLITIVAVLAALLALGLGIVVDRRRIA